MTQELMSCVGVVTREKGLQSQLLKLDHLSIVFALICISLGLERRMK